MFLILKLLLVARVVFGGRSFDGIIANGRPDPQELIGPDALLARLDRLLDACIVNYEDLTTDLLLGIAIANGQLQTILAESELPNRPFIEALQRKCAYVESRLDSIFSFPSGANAVVSKLLIDSHFWRESPGDDGSPASNDLHLSESGPKPKFSRKALRNYLQVLDVDAAPSELQSDQCLSELLVNESENEYNASAGAKFGKMLHLSQECNAAMSVRRRSYGYHLTHKLLFYIILAKQRFANVELDFVVETQRQLCGQMLREANFITDLNYPEMLRDLFMEQIFLCAYAGFGEFRNPSWLVQIVGWQSSNGCFRYLYHRDPLQDGSNNLGGVCSTHMTGVGAAVLGLFAKLQLVV
ncbi:uncharacterized protein LOC129748627 [Uranotaenia lowii]|uniref:uncharacterized protein LOC129748627 n=1 Tax=Uranotaenia lowii TaxID=190385 RepID=UPI00247A434C|nr:uncharacterized protein LOC129748627 [Uranotaenia lowii]